MRLLETSSLTLHEFVANYPPYAILSHTWHSEEVLYQDFRNGAQEEKTGYEKVKGFCELARSEGHRYAWVDTCCIDKSSSAELQESINSMFNWYKDATTCYVYLEDVELNGLYLTDAQLESARWMTRGWTLQELIAPSHVRIYSAHWEFCGTRQDLARQLYQITKIDLALLNRTDEWPRLYRFSVAQRMSWASKRITTRPEDVAYCLLGIFDVQMSLLYGEGGAKAFFRLQEAIMQHSTDYSILAWDPRLEKHWQWEQVANFFAASPSAFGSGGDIICINESQAKPFEVTNAGLKVQLPVIKKPGGNKAIAVLHNCRYLNDFDGAIGVELFQSERSSRGYERCISGPVMVDEWDEAEPATILIEGRIMKAYYEMWDNACFKFEMEFSTGIPHSIRNGLSIRVPPIGDWYAVNKTLRLDAGETSSIWEDQRFSCTLCYDSNHAQQRLLQIGFNFQDRTGPCKSYGIFKTSVRPTFSRHKPPRAVRFRVGGCELKLRVVLSQSGIDTGEWLWTVGLYFQMLRRRRRLMPARLARSKASRVDEIYYPVPFDTKAPPYINNQYRVEDSKILVARP